MNKHLLKLCQARGVQLRDRGHGHYQLEGPLLVNYYPGSKNRTAYVAGTKKAARHVSPERAVEMCFEAPESQGEKDKRPKNTRRIRKRLLKTMPFCHWCDKPLSLDTSTLEHIIPLDRGGLDNDNNRALACPECNHGRGNTMPELEIEVIGNVLANPELLEGEKV